MGELPSRLERKTDELLPSWNVAQACSTLAFGTLEYGKIQEASILIVGGRLYRATMTWRIHFISVRLSLVAKSGRHCAHRSQFLHWTVAHAHIAPLFGDT